MERTEFCIRCEGSCKKICRDCAWCPECCQCDTEESEDSEDEEAQREEEELFGKLEWPESDPEPFSAGDGPPPRTATPQTGMRTDRHNNPTAFTVDIAEQAGLVPGVDYTEGDPFPNNPSQRTARLIGDPVALTINVLDRIGFYTQRGQPRWTHTAIQQNEWLSYSNQKKKAVIGRMYRNEGGSSMSQMFA